MAKQNENEIEVSTAWKTRTIIGGALVGAFAGLIGAYLLTRRAERTHRATVCRGWCAIELDEHGPILPDRRGAGTRRDGGAQSRAKQAASHCAYPLLHKALLPRPGERL